VLEEIRRISSDGAESHHERYLHIYRLIHRRNEQIALGFDDMRRSRAMQKICYLRSIGLFTDEEFARFAEQTRKSVQMLIGR
jgi:hypothetical protein